MKKIFLFVLLLLTAYTILQAQTPTPELPSKLPTGNQLPLPKIAPLKPDLYISEVTLNYTKPLDSGITKISLSFKVQNIGTTRSPRSIVQLSVYAYSLDHTTDHTFWQPVGEPVEIPVLENGRAARTFNVVFLARGLIRGRAYPAKITANPFGEFAEISVENNKKEFELNN